MCTSTIFLITGPKVGSGEFDYLRTDHMFGAMPILVEGNCKKLPQSLIGLSLASDFLTAFAKNPKGRPLVFSFAFKDLNTGDGQNWFSMGGYAGLDKNKIKWIPRPLKFESPVPMDNAFLVTIPQLTLKNGKTMRLKHNYAIGPDAGDLFVVDTGSGNSLIPWTVEKDLYRDIPEYHKEWLRNREGKLGKYGFLDLRKHQLKEYPRIGLQIGDREWLTSMANLNVGIPNYLKKYIHFDDRWSILPVAFQSHKRFETNEIPSRGIPRASTFCRNLKESSSTSRQGRRELGLFQERQA
jgi:hypothetical protein